MTSTMHDDPQVGASPGSQPAGLQGRPRAALIINPYSSAMTARRERIIVQTLREHMDLQVRRTERSGHAPELARDLIDSGVDVIITCGGDGTANEALNGMQLESGTAEHRPMFAIIPAGGTNVLSRSLGVPNDPIKATRIIAEAITARRCTTINLGAMDERIFMFAAGMGLDGEVIKRNELARKGRRVSDARILAQLMGIMASERFALRERMTITIDDTGEQMRAAMVMVGNTTPLSYLGKLPLHFMPECSLQGGLDFIAPERAGTLFMLRNALNAAGIGRRRPSESREAAKALRHDVESFHIECDEPQPIQADGEFLGERSSAHFRVIRDAVRLVY